METFLSSVLKLYPIPCILLTSTTTNNPFTVLCLMSLWIRGLQSPCLCGMTWTSPLSFMDPSRQCLKTCFIVQAGNIGNYTTCMASSRLGQPSNPSLFCTSETLDSAGNHSYTLSAAHGYFWGFDDSLCWLGETICSVTLLLCRVSKNG